MHISAEWSQISFNSHSSGLKYISPSGFSKVKLNVHLSWNVKLCVWILTTFVTLIDQPVCSIHSINTFIFVSIWKQKDFCVQDCLWHLILQVFLSYMCTSSALHWYHLVLSTCCYESGHSVPMVSSLWCLFLFLGPSKSSSFECLQLPSKVLLEALFAKSVATAR